MAAVLIVEDDPRMRRLLVDVLTDEGHVVEAVGDGLAGLIAARSERFDVAAVDVALPGMSGVELCRHVRREGRDIGIVLVTARDGVDDRILGLDAGADDYLVKPFEVGELAARIRALLRRAASSGGRVELADLALDPAGVRATVAGRVLPLSAKEFSLLRLLVANSGAPVERKALLKEVWGRPDHYDAAIVDQYVSYVRKKLAAADAGVWIETVRGIGYRARSGRG